MAKVPLPPDTPEWRKKKVKPEDMPMSKAMQDYLGDKTSRERASQREEEDADQERMDKEAAPYKKGGSVKKKKRVRLADGGEPYDKYKGLPIKVETSGASDPDEEKRITRNNINEGIREDNEDIFPKGTPWIISLISPKGSSERNKAKAKKKEENHGFKKGGMVKVRGAGVASRGHGKGKMC